VGDEGAIWIRGESVRPSVIGAGEQLLVDGWLDTGDSGQVDEDRYIYITGRRRDLIVRGGLKVVPAEVERALLDHADVREAVVAGVPDERLGEVPVAWVRIEDGSGVADEDLRVHVRSRLSAYKVPVSIHFVKEFPRTDTGKVRKDALVSATLAAAEEST
jgi:long-chain acyl-CoA synthetase